MKNWNDVIVEKTKKDYMRKISSYNLIIFILIILLIMFLVIIRGDMTHVFAFTERKFFDYSIDQEVEKINGDSVLIEKLSDDLSLKALYESSVDVIQIPDDINNDPNSERVFNLSYFKNMQQNDVSSYKNGYEVKVLEENENADYQLNQSDADWHRALVNADKIFNFHEMDLGIEGQAISFYEKSVFYYYAGDYDNATKFYSVAIMNDDKNEVPIDQRFSVLYFDNAVKQIQSAGTLDNMESLNMAIMLDPTYYQAYYLRGLSWLRLGEKDLAKEDFYRCIAIAPDFADVYIVLGFIAYENGDFSKANNLFDRGIQLNKESGIGYLFKGMVFDQMNVPSGAKLFYEKAKMLLIDDGNLIFLNEFLNNSEK